ncbi:MAG: hypothetical protein M0Q41_13090 [Bacteroidales bacterium]|nr:hypothetical protein [Bacteroidales bacterium]
MKTKKLLLLIPFLLIMSLMGCIKEPKVSECYEPAIEVSFQGFGTSASGNDCTLQNIDYTQTEVVLVIDNIADFRKYVSCINGLEVDFSKHFVLAGRIKRPACAYMETQTLSLKCDQLHYSIEIGNMDCQKPTDVFYFAIVSKEYLKYPVKLSVTINER